MLHAYDERLLGDLLEATSRARGSDAGRAELRRRIAEHVVRGSRWRATARDRLVRLASITTEEVLLRPERLAADPRAVLLASIDEGALPEDGELCSLAEVARQSFPGSVPRILFAIDEGQRRGDPGAPDAARVVRGTDPYHRLVGSRAPAVRGIPLPSLEGGAFAPTTFHGLEDVALAAELFRTVTLRPAATPEEVGRFAVRLDPGAAPCGPDDPALAWRHARLLTEAAQAADVLARFYARCTRAGWVVWVDLDEGEPDDR